MNTTLFVVRSGETTEARPAIAHDSVNACDTKLRTDIPDTAKCAGETLRASTSDIEKARQELKLDASSLSIKTKFRNHPRRSKDLKVSGNISTFKQNN